MSAVRQCEAESKQQELYAAIVESHGSELDRLAAGYEADPAKRLDLRQEIHLQLWRSLRLFDGRCSLVTWMLRVAHNTATSYIRRERRLNAGLVGLEEIEQTAKSSAEAPDLDRRRALLRVTRLIHQLKPLDRQIMICYLEEMNAADIAEITGLSRANVAMKIHRIRKFCPAVCWRTRRMSDEVRQYDLRAIWKQQPEEETPVIVDQTMIRRTQQLHVSTRSEIVTAILAAVFFIGVLVWRLPRAGVLLQPIGLVTAALWIVSTTIRFRHIIWGPSLPPETSATGIAFYRRELEIRRDHLRNAWLWHGPLLLSSVLCVASFAGRTFPGIDRFQNAAPLFLILTLWTVIGIRRRLRQAAEIEREIGEISRLEDCR